MADGMFTRLGRLFDKGADRVTNSAAQIENALGLDPLFDTLGSGLAKIDDALGDHKNAARIRELNALSKSEYNRAHFVEERDKINAKYVSHSTGEPAKPVTPAPKTQRERTADVQRFLRAAGYGDLLTRHGEKNGGVDGARGGDMIAAEAQYRKDRHLAAAQDITAPNATPGIPRSARLREV